MAEQRQLKRSENFFALVVNMRKQQQMYMQTTAAINDMKKSGHEPDMILKEAQGKYLSSAMALQKEIDNEIAAATEIYKKKGLEPFW